MRSDKERVTATLIVGVFAFAVVLAYHHVVDGDLWARLAVGAQAWRTGGLMRHDVFAFTPTLPEWIDHEWGAGMIFFGLLNAFGPASLMLLKIVTACAAVLLCLFAARRERNRLVHAVAPGDSVRADGIAGLCDGRAQSRADVCVLCADAVVP